MKASNNNTFVFIMEFNDKKKKKSRRSQHKVLRFAAILLVTCYVYDKVEELYQKGM